MTQKDERIQQLAYQIWESEGRPAHEHDRHWEMATRLYEAEQEGVAKKTAAKKPRTTKAAASTDQPVASKARTTGKTKADANVEATGVGVAPATPKKPRASRKATTAKPAASE